MTTSKSAILKHLHAHSYWLVIYSVAPSRAFYVLKLFVFFWFFFSILYIQRIRCYYYLVQISPWGNVNPVLWSEFRSFPVIYINLLTRSVMSGIKDNQKEIKKEYVQKRSKKQGLGEQKGVKLINKQVPNSRCFNKRTQKTRKCLCTKIKSKRGLDKVITQSRSFFFISVFFCFVCFKLASWKVFLCYKYAFWHIKGAIFAYILHL